MTPPPRYLVDTNVLLELVRGSVTARYDLLGRDFKDVYYSFVSDAELQVIGGRRAWGATRWEAMREILRSFSEIPLL